MKCVERNQWCYKESKIREKQDKETYGDKDAREMEEKVKTMKRGDLGKIQGRSIDW